MHSANYIWEWIEQQGENGSRDAVWEEKLGERLAPTLPYLLRTEDLACRFPCELYNAGGGCQYRIMRMTRGNLVGVCDDRRCTTRDFEEAQLLQYKVNLPKLLRDTTRTLDLQPAVEPQDRFRNLWTLATIPGQNGGQVTVYFQRAVRKEIFEPAILDLLINSNNPFIVVTPTTERQTPKLVQQLHSRGCAFFTLVGSMEITERGLTWLPGGRERWERVLECVDLNIVSEPSAAAAYKRTAAMVERIEQKVEAVGMDMTTLRKENESLRLQLGNQLSALAGQVDGEFFHWVCTVLVEGSMHRASKRLDLPHTTFRERFNRYVQKGGIYRSLAKLIEVRRSGLGSRKLEALNATFGKHQTSAEPVYDNRAVLELLDALKSLNEDNWEDVRDEMLEILAELNG